MTLWNRSQNGDDSVGAVSTEHIRWLNEPALTRPVLIASFTGWNDAGDAASTALRTMIEAWDARALAEIDPEVFTDFATVRPQVRLDEQHHRSIVWPTVGVWSVSLPGGDVILVLGPEPALRWRLFCDQLVGIAERFGASMGVTLGALLADVPHSRPVPLIGTATDDAMIDRFFRPFVGGIQLDPTLGTSNRMFDVILQQLFRGDAVVPARGMGEIPAQLAGRLPHDAIHLDTPAIAVRPGSVTTPRGTVVADDVIVAAEGPAAAGLLDLPPVESNPATCVWFAADAPPIDDPLLVLDGEGPAYNIAVMSNVSPAYAPAGRSLIGAACPGRLDPDAEPAVRAQLGAIWGSTVEGWTHLRTDAIPHGQPAQPPFFPPKQRTRLADGLHVCGDHRDTASIQGALFSGRRCAEAILAGG